MHILLIDPLKCSGCGRCELACSYVKNGTFNPILSRVKLIRADDFASPIPMVCRQCTVPLCTFGCPTAAISKDTETGVVRINEDLCVGCYVCVISCPLGGISLAPGAEAPIKCDLCDGSPACASECDYGAIRFVEEYDAPYLKMIEASRNLPRTLEIMLSKEK